MGPLQYMVMGYDQGHFRDEILPELSHLTHKGVIRVVDLLFVKRDLHGAVTSQELGEVLPDQSKLIAEAQESSGQWFAQDDVDVVGEYLPDNTAVALLLFEHTWASRLDDAVHRANGSLIEQGLPPQSLASEIEHFLTMGAGVAAR